MRARLLALLLCLVGCGARTGLIDPPVPSSPDAGEGGGGGAPPATELDILGTWYSCSSTLTFEEDHTWRSVARKDGCVREGHWKLDGDRLDRWTDTSSCGAPPEPQLGVSVARPKGGLILYEEESSTGERIYLDGAAPRAVWKLDGEQSNNAGMLSTTAVIVGAADQGIWSACYWSTVGQCGGLFSCTGYITYWDLGPEKLIGQTSCIGDCPCGAVIDGAVLPDGSVDATFYGQTCNGSYSGHLVGVPQIEN